MNLRETLEGLTVDQLKKRAKLIDTDRRPTRKADLVALIAERLLGQDLAPLWKALSDLEKRAVSEAVHNWQGRFDRTRFRVKYAALPSHFEYRYSGYGRRAAEPKTPSYLPLVFHDQEIPLDLCERLAPLAPKPRTNEIETTPEAELPLTFAVDETRAESYPVKRVGTESLVRQDLPALLRMVEMGRVSVGPKTGVASAASLKAIESVLTGGDWYEASEDAGLERWAGGPIRPIRPYAWPLLLQAGGLTKLDGAKLVLTPKGRKALGQPLAATVKLLFERWQSKGAPDELRRIDLIKGQTSKGARLSAVSERRKVIADALGECPIGEWVAVDQLFRFMQLEGFGFEVTQNPWKLYFSDVNYGNLGDQGFVSFNVLQGRYALAYLFEYLATLGMIDVAYVPPYGVRADYADNWGTDECVFLSRYDGLLYLRLNALGAYCLGSSDDYVPEIEQLPPLLDIQPDLTLSLLREPSAAEHMLLEQYALARPDGRWRLNPDAAVASATRIDERERLSDFLEAAIDGDPPAELTEFLAVVEERARALQDAGTARLFSCRDAAFAAMLASDPATAPYCLRADERLIVVPQTKLSAFRKALEKLGYALPESLSSR